LSGPEIASEQMVPVNTMNTHTRNIHAKLGVNNCLAEELRLF
jgi:DNA-binding CsgD family transcriptional regulator